MCNFRVGHGYDVHRLVAGRKLILGGVHIPYDFGLDGHSDADVIVHAMMDAILGAMGLGDIGRHFPDTSDEFLDASSLLLLEKVRNIMAEKDAVLINMDATVVIEHPKVAPYINEMITNIANILKVDHTAINIKATTEEHLGFTGNGEGVAAHAVVLIAM